MRASLAAIVENYVTEEEQVDTIAHLAFYSGWPNAMTAITVAKKCLRDQRLTGTKANRRVFK